MPAIVEVSKVEDEMLNETFAPILYVKEIYRTWRRYSNAEQC